ncbi:sensor histidine kinase [Pseudothauera rhizosphaerae]|uniref:histidine kinase n=1 Tax=Pseudothauera rhizosphaerae TaxID=2565932 RepID=A0A4S4ALU5_9RHOO|nr:sensor histidine kinase [Pseudothauera rhizosphaerae]THF60528.1 histidine kinase [Pseudothauera rhizosphaerae]
MLSGGLIVSVSFAYLLLLFAVAYFGDRRADQGRSIIANPWTYALSLAVYCTAWTYFGSVGRAASGGVWFLPIYLGPTLGFALSWLVILKMIRIAKTYRITSIADFIASRYGKSHLLGGLVSIIAVVGTVPYIALQLKAISSGYALLIGEHDAAYRSIHAGSWLQDSTLYIALLLAVFTVLFGTRHLDATERHEGMVAAIAFESVVKLVAFLAVGLFVTYGLFDGFGDIFARAYADADLAGLFTLDGAGGSYGGWFALTLLAMLSVIFLPRQFQVTVVENVNEQHLRRATWLFPAYLLAINVFVLPIALGGLLLFGQGAVDPDTFVLTLPLVHGQKWLALLAFVGGLSASTGMVIVETIALSTMVCNDLVMPLLLRLSRFKQAASPDLTGLLLAIRRGAILLVLLLGYVYFRLAGEAYALVAIGLISFAAVAQFAPAMLGGMYWRGGTREGALAGLAGGFLLWTYTLLLPSFAKSGWLDPAFLEHGLFGLAWLKPEQLFGLQGLDNISHALFWSMAANIGCYVLVSVLRSPTGQEASQATLFVDVFRRGQTAMPASFWRGSAEVSDLLPLVARFLGTRRAMDAFNDYARTRGVAHVQELKADAGLVHFAETLLAGAIGSASARVMVSSVVQEEPLGLDEVMNILDEASQVRAYSHQLEEKSRALQAATDELRRANEQLKELDRLKDDFMSSVTHELRTPLTSIRAFSEMLHDDPRIDLAERTRFLGIIVSETARLTRLVNQVLDMAKIESGHAEWHNTDIDMRQLVEHAVGTTAQLFRDRGAAVELSLPDAVPLLRADHDRMVQVMLNLLSNAAKFVPAGEGRVKVALTHGGGELRVDVADNGPGIPPESAAVIFEKFRQGGDQRSRPQGTGLGLPISKQIVEHFGGRLWVTSSPGEGATFSFVLPLAEGAAESAAAAHNEIE